MPRSSDDPDVQLDTETVSKLSVTRLDTENPVPATVTGVPTGPCPGVTVIATAVTVKDAEFEYPLASVAVTVVPDVPEGTANVQLNPPEGDVVSDPLVQLDIVTLSNTSVIALDGEKLVPEAVTLAPIGPCPGVTVRMASANVTVTDFEAPFTTRGLAELNVGTYRLSLAATVNG